MSDNEAPATISQEELMKQIAANEIFIKVENEIDEPSEYEDESERNVDDSSSDDETFKLKRRKNAKQPKTKPIRRTEAERSKAYRERLKLRIASLKSSVLVTPAEPKAAIHVKPQRRTSAERSKAYRERIKLLKAALKSAESTAEIDKPTRRSRADRYRERIKLLKLADPTAAIPAKPPRSTNAERCKASRERLKLRIASLKSSELLNAISPNVPAEPNAAIHVKPQRRTSAERSKAYRERMRLLRELLRMKN